MIEQRLQQAANQLPKPSGDFSAVMAAATQTPAKPAGKPRRLVAAICLILLLAGCAAGPTIPEYHLYNGNLNLLFPGIAFDVLCEELGYAPEWSKAQESAAALGWTLPESLGGSPRYSVDKYNLTTQESHWLAAMLVHHYTYYSVAYGYEQETEIALDDGSQSTAHWTEAGIQMTFGSMENPVWRRQFGFNEENTRSRFSKSREPESTSSIEYKGITIYTETYCYDNDFYGLLSPYGHYVIWIDEEYNTAFSLYSREDSLEFAVSCGKELIDQLHPEH